MKTSMPANTNLVKEWIQFLKNQRIASTSTDPTTGKLQYRRQPTTQDLKQFLSGMTDYKPKEIDQAIGSVLSSKLQSAPPAQSLAAAPPAQAPEPEQKSHFGPDSGGYNYSHPTYTVDNKTAKKEPHWFDDWDQPEDFDHQDHNPNGVEDNEPAEPEEPKPKKPHYKYFDPKKVQEAFDVGDNGSELSEDDIEAIFSALETVRSAPPPAAPSAPPPGKNYEALKQIKRAIRDTMTDAQRKSLWRALHDAL